MAAWGFNIVAMKILVTHFMPITITAFRILTAGLAVLLALSVMRKLRLPTKQEWFYVIFGSLFNVVLYFTFLSIGLTKTTASNAGLILGMVPLLTTILAILFLGDKATILRGAGIFLGLVGVSFIVLEGDFFRGKHWNSSSHGIYFDFVRCSIRFRCIRGAVPSFKTKNVTISKLSSYY
jgi:drug/metabolite transporter (DMT)-like permease